MLNLKIEKLNDFIPIPNFENFYLINIYGNIWSIRKKKLLKHRITKNGYHHVNLFNGIQNKEIYIHRIVAQIFIPNSQNYSEINHKDGNKGNNNINNLEWVTHSYNHIHLHSILKKGNGENNGNSKLIEEQIIAIRNDRKNGLKLKDIAKKYNILIENARDICSGRIWKYLPFEKERRINGKLTTSKYKGVSWDKKNNKWFCSIKFNKKQIYIGRFNTEIESAQAYNKKSIELFGEFAYVNKI